MAPPQYICHLLVRISTNEEVVVDLKDDSFDIANAVTECFWEFLNSEDVNRAEIIEVKTVGEWHLAYDKP